MPLQLGLKYVTGDAIIIIDADLQDPPELIPDMLKQWEQGYEVIYGKRKLREGESKFKLLTAKMFYRIIGKKYMDAKWKSCYDNSEKYPLFSGADKSSTI